MATLKRYIINGVTVHPTEVDIDDMKIEDSDRMANGKLRTWLRAYKKRWTLTWSSLTEDSIAPLRTLYRNSSAVTLNDENNTNYTVISREYTENLSAEREANNKLYYDVDLVFEEV